MKPKIKFGKDIEKDIKNWWLAVNKESFGKDFSRDMPKEIRSKIRGKEFREVKDYLRKEIKKYYEGFEFLTSEFREYWKNKEGAIIRKLEKIHNREFPVGKVIIYYTSCQRCPYDFENNTFWMQINEFDRNKDRLCCIITHELMHLFFMEYYWNKCKERGLNNEEIDNIKEAFSVIINLEFQDIFQHKDRGYPKHKKLREFIEQEWDKNNNFERVLGRVCKYLKEK